MCNIHKMQDLNLQGKDYNFEQLDKGSMNSPE